MKPSERIKVKLFDTSSSLGHYSVFDLEDKLLGYAYNKSEIDCDANAHTYKTPIPMKVVEDFTE